MDSGIDDLLVEVAYKVSSLAAGNSVFGDAIYTSPGPAVACLFRDISTVHNSISNRYEVSIDGIMWFPASEDARKSDIYHHQNGEYYMISQVTKAKTLVTDDQVQFIRCTVSRQRQVS